MPNILMLLHLCVIGLIINNVSSQETFTNPIFETNSADPTVALVGDFYYLVISTRSEHELTIFKSSEMTNFRNCESQVIYSAPNTYSDLWASELHEIDGELYIYFAMNIVGVGHRPWALKANDPKDPMAGWSDPILMFPTGEWEDIGAIDGTLLRHGGVQYFVYVRFPTIWISRMSDPVTAVRAGTVLLREPTRPWEGGTNEGPFFIYNKNVSYMVFAIGGSFDPSYGLGLMSIDEGKDPMVPENWWYGPDEAVFWKNEEEKVLGPGHAAFTTSPDKTETWFVYHAHENNGVAGGHRTARADKITWADDGKPVFPRPHGYFNPQPVPSGQVASSKDTFTNPIISGNSAEPHVSRIGDNYYLALSTDGNKQVTIYQSNQLTNFRNSPSKVALSASDCIRDIWAPEIHEIDGELYLYVAYSTCDNGHRIYVIKANNANNPLGDWSEPIQLMPSYDDHAVDPTILKHTTGRLYLAFSGNTPNLGQGIYMALMDNPTSVVPDTQTLIHSPSLDWEGQVNQGPSFVENAGSYFLIYSVGYTFNQDYRLREMSIYNDLDPLQLSNWWLGDDEPVFWKNEEEGVFATGHSGFVKSPDNSETWMTYHASEDANNVDGFRVARIEKITFDAATTRPIFPRPNGYFTPQPLPKGQA